MSHKCDACGKSARFKVQTKMTDLEQGTWRHHLCFICADCAEEMSHSDAAEKLYRANLRRENKGAAQRVRRATVKKEVNEELDRILKGGAK